MNIPIGEGKTYIFKQPMKTKASFKEPKYWPGDIVWIIVEGGLIISTTIKNTSSSKDGIMGYVLHYKDTIVYANPTQLFQSFKQAVTHYKKQNK